MIRELASDELHLIENLARVIWPVSFKEMISSAQIEYMLDWMYNQKKLNDNFRKGHKFAVCTQNKKLSGFISFETKIGKSTVRIHKLYVHHLIQKKGIGKQLLDYAIKEALRKKMTSIDLFVNRTNPAVLFYKHLCFTIEEEIDLDIGNGYFMNDYRMKLKI